MSNADNKTSPKKVSAFRMGETAEYTPNNDEPSFKTKYIRYCGSYTKFRKTIGKDFFAISKSETKRLYQKKYGRNSICFCGSEKKVKKCCMNGS